MFPFKHSSIFRSRWMALLWAAGIIWFALDAVPAAPTDGNGDNAAAQTDALGQPINEEQAKQLIDRLGN